MVSREFYTREELAHYKIKGQIRPFVDEADLQLKIPGTSVFDNQSVEDLTHVYSHYMGLTPPPYTNAFLPFDPVELDQAMETARQAYQAWKKMKDQLKSSINS